MSKPRGFDGGRFHCVGVEGFRKQPTVKEHDFDVENSLDKPVYSSSYEATSENRKGMNHTFLNYRVRTQWIIEYSFS